MVKSYYDYKKIVSFNATYNFIVGGRGLGKTYGGKQLAINAWVKRKHQFIYLRRYKTEVSSARRTFFADIAHEYPEYDFRVNGVEAQASKTLNIDSYASEADHKKAEKSRVWETMGYFMALSTGQTQKGTSFPKVKTILYDEFIIEKGALSYLPEEEKVFNNLYSTVDRWKDKTKVFFLANSVSIMNPYFIAYEIRPDEGEEFVRKAGGFIAAHFPDSTEFANEVYQTKFGQFISGTEYGDFAVGNTFADANDNLLREKGYKAKYRFTLECRAGSFSVWYDASVSMYFIRSKLPKDQVHFTLLPERVSDGKTLMTRNDKTLAYLRAAFNNAMVMFDKPSTRNVFTEVFKR